MNHFTAKVADFDRRLNETTTKYEVVVADCITEIIKSLSRYHDYCNVVKDTCLKHYCDIEVYQRSGKFSLIRVDDGGELKAMDEYCITFTGKELLFMGLFDNSTTLMEGIVDRTFHLKIDNPIHNLKILRMLIRDLRIIDSKIKYETDKLFDAVERMV